MDKERKKKKRKKERKIRKKRKTCEKRERKKEKEKENKKKVKIKKEKERERDRQKNIGPIFSNGAEWRRHCNVAIVFEVNLHLLQRDKLDTSRMHERTVEISLHDFFLLFFFP